MCCDPIEDCIRMLLRYALDEEHKSLKRELKNKKRRISERLKNSQNNVRYHQLVNEHFVSAIFSKTSLAEIIAYEMDVPFISVLAASIRDEENLKNILSQLPADGYDMETGEIVEPEAPVSFSC